MQDLVERLTASRQKISDLLVHLDLPAKEQELDKLQKQSEVPDLWDDPQSAQRLMKKLSAIKDEVEGWHNLVKRIQDTLDLAKMGDESFRAELEAETGIIEQDISQRELDVLLSGPYDRGNALLEVNSGAGGTDSQDWAAMLERMYIRWAEKAGYGCEILDSSEGEEAGIKSVTLAITGSNAYGYLKGEKGVHRLVRLSPFDSNHRRHTSFAQVEVLPEAAEDDPDIVINPDDLRIDVFRSSGAGGQNVQKNATAIRITHIPSGIVVACQNERSQLQNRENAMRVLRSRLLDIARAEQEQQLAELRGEYTKTEWGSQIRSYVLHPYQMVKDHRTDYETGNTQAVLDGDIEGFIESYLRWKKD
ncbi:MAG TPA: peptide chain release factor 2 [Anaerolineaceae bacterium]|nr:peptide chain release factor 2 [Anaerolineaceae bacterium]